jgi:hypothetical protein
MISARQVGISQTKGFPDSSFKTIAIMSFTVFFCNGNAQSQWRMGNRQEFDGNTAAYEFSSGARNSFELPPVLETVGFRKAKARTHLNAGKLFSSQTSSAANHISSADGAHAL